MQIPPTGLSGPSNTPNATASTGQTQPATTILTLPNSLLAALKVGQVLTAQVLSDSTVNGETQLRIRQTNVTLHSPSPLRSGQLLTLQITDPTQGIQARVQTSAAIHVAQAATRHALPLQMALAPLLNSLLQISQSAVGISPVPEALRQLAQDVLRQITRWQTTRDANILRQAISQSGIFLEAMLERNEVAEGDLKASLLRLLASLQGQPTNRSTQLSGLLQDPPPLRYGPMHAPETASPTIPSTELQMGTVHRQLLGALARIELAQLASITTEEDPARVLMTEVPLRNDAGIDVLQLRIEQDEEAPTNPEPSKEQHWNIQLAFELSGLGPLYVRLGLRGEIVSTTFWAERTQTKQVIDKHLDLYRTNLSHAGISSGTIQTQVGRPPHSHKSPLTPKLNVDIKV